MHMHNTRGTNPKQKKSEVPVFVLRISGLFRTSSFRLGIPARPGGGRRLAVSRKPLAVGRQLSRAQS